MSSHIEIEKKVREIVYEHTDIDENEKISDTASFTDDLHIDSLTAVELIMSLEEEFDCEIADEEAEKITNIKSAVEYIKKNI